MSIIGVYVEILFDTFVTIFYHFYLWFNFLKFAATTLLSFMLRGQRVIEKVDTF